MKVKIHAEDPAEVLNADGREESRKIVDLIDGLVLELGYFPRKGETLSFMIGDYALDAKVHGSYMNYYEPGNKHYKESVWGVNYDVFLEDIEIIAYNGE